MSTAKRNRRKTDSTPSRWSLEQLWPLLQQMRPAFGMSVTIVGIAVAMWIAVRVLDRPIAKVEVGGQFQRVAPVQIEEAVAPFRGQGFLSVNLDSLQAALEMIPWVDRARVERRWPNAVRVLVTEHVPAARWGNDGLMNTRGELFLRGARHLPPELPQLIGPEGKEDEVAKLYLETYPRLLAVGMRLNRVELDARGAWQLTLGNGVSRAPGSTGCRCTPGTVHSRGQPDGGGTRRRSRLHRSSLQQWFFCRLECTSNPRRA